MNYKTLAEQFWADGYLVLENFFSTELMDEYNRLILGHFDGAPEFIHDDEFLDKSQTDVIPWFPQQEGIAVFDIVENDERLNVLTEGILGEGWYALYCMVMFSGAGTKGQAWHQDCPPDRPDIFNMNRLVYSHDISEVTGGKTIVVPGSHRRGLLSVGPVDEDFASQVVLMPSKGTVVLLHGHTWHRVTPVTGRYRVSTNYRSAPQNAPENVTDICIYRNMRYQFSISSVIEERV